MTVACSGSLPALFRACATATTLAGLLPLASAAPLGPPDGGAESGVFTLLHGFTLTDGYGPSAALLQTSDGNFYGTTAWGGTEGYFNGTVFRLTPQGAFTSLHSFAGSEGLQPEGALVEGPDGWLYGTASGGGSSKVGTIFRISREGVLEVVHQFAGAPDDGAYPFSGLTPASDGNWYGTTPSGGRYNDGVVYRLAPDGTVTVIHSFGANSTEVIGDFPSQLIQGNDGLLYGSTGYGGPNPRCSVEAGCGSLFSMTLDGVIVAHVGMYDAVGQYPRAGIMEGSDRYFYGVAQRGGHVRHVCEKESCGTIFRVRPGGRLERVHAFDGEDGWVPDHAPIQGSDGSLYGVTPSGGRLNACGGFGCGTVWRVSPGGAFSVVYRFREDDGFSPESGLVEGRDGALYGTTTQAGPGGYGTIFRLAPRADDASTVKGAR